ncbi:MAG: hypothetical protein L6300_07770, partial [Syntrophaceae bacterium]|nr:hypothetical protein [Pseudomonadota bacterium]MCG2740124.1 hypothetical protein [Syntrophaceae bacterium]
KELTAKRQELDPKRQESGFPIRTDSSRISQGTGENRDSETSQNRQGNAFSERGSIWTAVKITCR